MEQNSKKGLCTKQNYETFRKWKHPQNVASIRNVVLWQEDLVEMLVYIFNYYLVRAVSTPEFVRDFVRACAENQQDGF